MHDVHRFVLSESAGERRFIKLHFLLVHVLKLCCSIEEEKCRAGLAKLLLSLAGGCYEHKYQVHAPLIQRVDSSLTEPT